MGFMSTINAFCFKEGPHAMGTKQLLPTLPGPAPPERRGILFSAVVLELGPLQAPGGTPVALRQSYSHSAQNVWKSGSTLKIEPKFLAFLRKTF